jgi:hypothetical protein
MSNRRKSTPPPENIAHKINCAVMVPIYVSKAQLKFWLIFYGLTKQELIKDHVSDAMQRRGLAEHEFFIATEIWETAA